MAAVLFCLVWGEEGAIKVKPVGEVRDKWLEVTPGRASYYEKGAVGAGADWEKNAVAAASAFKMAVTSPNIDKMYSGGVKKAGGAKFDRKVRDVGVARFSTGVQAAGVDYESGVAPMLDTIAALTLTARAPRGAPSNYNRVTEIGTALNKKRLALRAAGA